MKAINGWLDMSKKYELVDIEYSGLQNFDFESCENCGNIIKNVAIVENEHKNKYRIGLDCLETIVNMSPSQIQEAKNRVNRTRRFIQILKTQAKCITVEKLSDGKYYFRMYKFYTQKWDVRALGYGCFEKYYKVITSFDIPIFIKNEED